MQKTLSRKTFERIERIKKADPELAQRVLSRELSIAAAYERVRAAERRKVVDAGRGLSEGRAPELTADFDTYRTVYLDPERSIETGIRLTAAPFGSLRSVSPWKRRKSWFRLWLWGRSSWWIVRPRPPTKAKRGWNPGLSFLRNDRPRSAPSCLP